MKTKKQPVRLGVFGGSFDPPHAGHLMVAEIACEEARLDQILFVPAYEAPHKIGRHTTAARHRLAMTRAAIRDNPRFIAWDFEIRKETVSYTIDTLRALRSTYPACKLFLILGADSLAEFATWKSPEEITLIAEVLVYPRPGYKSVHDHPSARDARVLTAPIVDLSSSSIRRRVASGKSIRYLVPEAVERYIRRYKLYLGEG